MPHKRYNPASQAGTNSLNTTTITSTSRTTVTPPQNTDQAKDSAVMADKLRTQQQLEALQAKHVGTGHADTTKFEWTSNIHRDTLASIVGHPPLLQYVAIGMGLPREIVRKNLLEKMIRPVGPPPEVSDLKSKTDPMSDVKRFIKGETDRTHLSFVGTSLSPVDMVGNT
ncbi:hypothetical protein B0A49_03934 [Cryomyces minteri]|uniref:Splicing factor 3B subunit 5 n=1 Tax=Cryomyces minteri TaxID=331657 RepID=A0A4U0X687_9PEZI|nr:hypothetical protein B0A49_03934 [Cryomyces minteri]